jgi:hypothetical protein
MAGGIMQLVAYGAQYVYFTGPARKISKKHVKQLYNRFMKLSIKQVHADRRGTGPEGVEALAQIKSDRDSALQ